MDHDPDAGHQIDPAPLHFRNEGRLLFTKPPRGVAQHALDRSPGLRNGEKHGDDLENHHRAHHGNFRIAAHNDGVGVMARVAPAPHRGFAHDHKARNVINGVVHPARLERRAVAAFMPARIRG